MALHQLVGVLVTLIGQWYTGRLRFLDELRSMRRRRMLTIIQILNLQRAMRRPRRRERRCWRYIKHQLFWEEDVPRWPDDKFQANFRLSRNTFITLCSDLRNHLKKRDTTLRKCIPVEKRVAIALYFLKSGADYLVVGTTFGIGKSTVCYIIDEFCDAVCDEYQDIIKFPCTEAEQVEMSNGFLKYWQFPNTLSAIDGSHIPILTPEEYGEDYYNYKGWHSTILMAAVDYRYRFANTYYNDEGLNLGLITGGLHIR
jgi:hypothetical protein